MPTSPNYYSQGWIYGPPTCVILHATRSGRADFDHLQELTATVGWFMNPDSGASSHWVVSPTDTVRLVSDDYPSWATGWHNWMGYNIEVTQPLWNTPFEDGHYTNLARVCADYVRQGIPIRRIEYLPYSSKEKGFVQHQDTEQGISAGKSDMGVMFDWARFFAELRNEVQEVDMPLTDADKVWLYDKMQKASLTPEAKQWIDAKITKVILAVQGAHQVTRASGVGGLTAEDTKQVVKDALSEGTG